MPRLKLKPLDHYSHSIPFTLRVTDINYGGHLSNDAALGLMHQARIEILHDMGVSEMDLGDGQSGLVQTDCGICYLGEGFLLDRVDVQCAFTDIKNSTFRMCYRIVKDGDTLILAELGFAGFDYRHHRPVGLPQSFRDLLSSSRL